MFGTDRNGEQLFVGDKVYEVAQVPIGIVINIALGYVWVWYWDNGEGEHGKVLYPGGYDLVKVS